MIEARYAYVTRDNTVMQLHAALPPIVLAGMTLDPGDGWFYIVTNLVWSQLGGYVVNVVPDDEAPPLKPRLLRRDMEERGWKIA